VSEHISHVTELTGGTSTLVLTLSLSAQAVTLEIREKNDREVRLHKLTERCSALYRMAGNKKRLAGVLLHLTDGFRSCLEGYRAVTVRHVVDACKVLDVRVTDNTRFAEIVKIYNHDVFSWLEPFRNLVIPRDFAQELRKIE
jgi:hypothetical protein